MVRIQKERFKYTKEERSWIMQDWANSAYSIMITTAVFPLFFKAVAESGGVGWTAPLQQLTGVMPIQSQRWSFHF